MRVFLIDPPGIDAGLNVGLGYLVSSVVQEGFEEEVLDLNNNLKRQDIYQLLKNKVVNFSPDIVGFSIHSLTYNISVKLIKFLKDFYSGWIIVGGPQASVEQEKIFNDCPEVNFILTGEGEESFKKFLQNLKNEHSLKEVPGLIFKSNEGIVKSTPFQLIKNLDTLPLPDYSLFGIKRWKCYPLITSRGCPYNCIFCFSHLGKKWRACSPNFIIEEIKTAISKYKITSFAILDAVFNLDIDRAESFCEMLVENSINLPWTIEGMRADRITPSLAKKLKRVNCYSVSVGIESLIPEIYEKLNKGCTLQEVRGGIKILQCEKIKVAGNFVIGLPGDNYKLSLKCFQLLKELKLNSAVFQLLVPYPNTEIFEWVKKYGKFHYTYKEVDAAIFKGKALSSFSTGDFSKDEREKIFEVMTIKSGIYPPKLRGVSYLRYTFYLLSKIIKCDFFHLPQHLFKILIIIITNTTKRKSFFFP